MPVRGASIMGSVLVVVGRRGMVLSPRRRCVNICRRRRRRRWRSHVAAGAGGRRRLTDGSVLIDRGAAGPRPGRRWVGQRQRALRSSNIASLIKYDVTHGAAPAHCCLLMLRVATNMPIVISGRPALPVAESTGTCAALLTPPSRSSTHTAGLIDNRCSSGSRRYDT